MVRASLETCWGGEDEILEYLRLLEISEAVAEISVLAVVVMAGGGVMMEEEYTRSDVFDGVMMFVLKEGCEISEAGLCSRACGWWQQEKADGPA